MTQETNNSDDELEKLRIENEIKKMKLTLKHGADFSHSPEESKLDPLLEAQFLDNIERFENAYNNCKQIPVYDLIGKPEYKKAGVIPDDEIHTELQKIMQVMNENGIFLDTLCEVDDRVLYRFITEELFLHETDDIRVAGMAHNFIFEEFHPNHDHDIRNHSTDFIETYLNKESDFYNTFLTKEAENDNILKNFRDAFSSFSLNHFEIKTIHFDEENANVGFEINFSGTIEGSTETQNFSGEGKIELIYMYDYWCIHTVNFPSYIS
ncbi:MAG: hypothetical protein V1904_14260 [Bacteroidota bacterium]